MAGIALMAGEFWIEAPRPAQEFWLMTGAGILATVRRPTGRGATAGWLWSTAADHGQADHLDYALQAAEAALRSVDGDETPAGKMEEK